MAAKKVQEFIDRNNLLSREGKHLVALSGGADSIALLRILSEAGYDVEAIHCNFHLRGEESNRDEEFCQRTCQRLGIPLHLVHFDTIAYSSLHHISIEMAARDLRYNHFRLLKEAIGAESICVAHHKDDCVETVLMNMVRGTGIKGLTGIRAKNGDIIRPLLCLTRREIEDYLLAIGQDYVTDSTNLTDEATRNRYRHNVIPAMREINPSAVEAIAATARHVEDVMPLLDACKERCRKECVTTEGGNDSVTKIDLPKIMSWPSARYLLFSILCDEGITSQTASQIASVVTSQQTSSRKAGSTDTLSGKRWQAGEKTVVKDRDTLLISHREDEFREMTFPEEGCYVTGEGRKMSLKRFARNSSFTISRDAMVVDLDADTLSFPLHLRKVRNGDRFMPLGMKGSKLVSDYLTDRKKSLIEKARQLCLTDACGNILWLVGERINDRNKTREKTENILEIRYMEDNIGEK